jgi:hypothetical protein
MRYDKTPTKYTFPSTNFGSTSTLELRGPLGKRGRVVNYGVENITTTFTAVTLPGTMAIGVSGNTQAYGNNFSLGTAAADSGTKHVMGDFPRGQPAYHNIIPEANTIPANTLVLVTCNAPTGGTPAGVGTPFVEIIWQD